MKKKALLQITERIEELLLLTQQCYERCINHQCETNYFNVEKFTMITSNCDKISSYFDGDHKSQSDNSKNEPLSSSAAISFVPPPPPPSAPPINVPPAPKFTRSISTGAIAGRGIR
jgi:hypothetical protein